MNHRSRALAAMRGEPVDGVPFIARMDLWYSFNHNKNSIPAPYENASLWDLQRDLGIGIFGFGAWDISFFKLEHHGVEVVSYAQDDVSVTEYRTPYGTLTCKDRMAEELAEAAGTSARIEYPFKSENDYDALAFLIEHTRVVDNFDIYGEFVDSIGNDGVALPFAGHLPAHQLMISYMGYETFYYQLFENENRLEALIDALTERYNRILSLAANCPAQAIEVGGNYDETMTPPPIFDRYFAPIYRNARELLSANDKILVVHGDGEMKALLRHLMECGVEVVEALTPKPMTSIDIAEVRRLWKDRVTLWGGIPSVILTNVFSEEEFERALEDLFAAIAPGDRFILGYGDNVPTDALFDRIKKVAVYWSEHSSVPIAAGT